MPGEAPMNRKHYRSLISSLFGRLASARFPAPVQKLVNFGYVKAMGLDMDEFEDPGSYPTLNALFTRALARPRNVDPDPGVAISPCDAEITDMGTIEKGQAYQIKGMAYDTAGVLGSFCGDEARKLEGGKYANFYLSPRDYHRYHIPFDLKVESVTHIPGKLYPVNLPMLRRRIGLFVENERVVLQAADRMGKRHFIILVGALNVGKMVLGFEPRIRTNGRLGRERHYRYDFPVEMKKGKLFGWFEMGSTIVILSEKDSIEYDMKIGDRVAYGQSIGRLGERKQ